MFTGIWRLYKKSGKRCQVLWKFQSSADSRNLQGNLYILLLWYSIMIQYYVFFAKYLVFLIYCAVVKPKKYPPFCQNWFCYSLLPRKGEYNPEIFTFFFYKIKLFGKAVSTCIHFERAESLVHFKNEMKQCLHFYFILRY